MVHFFTEQNGGTSNHRAFSKRRHLKDTPTVTRKVKKFCLLYYHPALRQRYAINITFSPHIKGKTLCEARTCNTKIHYATSLPLIGDKGRNKGRACRNKLSSQIHFSVATSHSRGVAVVSRLRTATSVGHTHAQREAVTSAA